MTTGLKFSVPDPFGNTVALYANTWDVHILEGHKEMEKLLRAVENTVRNPGFAYRSSISDISLIFHGHNLLTPDPKILRAVIKYPGILNVDEVVGGTFSGIVTTALVLRPENEFTGNIGPEFYRRPSKGKKKK